MFRLAGYIGIYSYFIFCLGIFALLTNENVRAITLLWLIVCIFIERKFLFRLFRNLRKLRFRFKKPHHDPATPVSLRSQAGIFTWFRLPLKGVGIVNFLFILFVLQVVVNLTGALGPELAFDALWYHLTLPKLYLLHNVIYHIPGGLLYYSDMPKLGETLYIGALSFGNEMLAKLIHFSFGIVITLALYKFSRKFFDQTVALLIVVIFYSNLVIDWESITAYIDLIRTFFEFFSLWGLINWYESQKSPWLVVSGIMMGLAITTKLLAIGSFFILLALLITIVILKHKPLKEILSGSLVFTVCSFIIPLPWFIYSYVHTGNPVYPFFTTTYEVSANSPSVFKIFSDLWDLFIHAADPISPLYLIFLPLLFVFYKKLRKEIKIIVWYCGLSLILWYFTPRTGGGRFIVPYLPAFSFMCGAIYSEILKKNRTEWKYISQILLFVIIFVALISIGYRGLANKRYLPVIFGTETKQEFLSNNLNFKFGDFYDTDGYLAKHIKTSDTVLLFGFHNLYYVDFPFIDSSWVTKGDRFDYVMAQDTKLPSKYANWQLIYSNDKTMVQLYKPPIGECQKICKY